MKVYIPTKKRAYLIVNADDFGMTRGITDGIIEAHRFGIVTSTSLMVKARAASYAADISKNYPTLSVGLHVVFERTNKITTNQTTEAVKKIESQLALFVKLIGKKPTHLDVHAVPTPTPYELFATQSFASKYKYPLRGNKSTVLTKFYGMSGLASTPEKISIEALKSTLSAIKNGIYLLVCHPGKTSNRLADPYRTLRGRELQVLTSYEIRALLKGRNIELINFRQGGEIKL